MAGSSSQRVARMLSIVTYVHNAGVVDLDELATHFDVPRAQLKKDLDMLWCSGLPGYGGGDLIEVDRSDDLVQITNVEHMGITQPLRLSTEEGIALLAGVEALAQVPGVEDADTIAEVREILATALGSAAEAAPELELELVEDAAAIDTEIAATVRAGLDSGKRLKITYVSNSDETTTREVDPLRIVAAEGHSYLRAWCYRAGGERAFRLDRISGAKIMDVAAAPPAEISPDFSLTPQEGERVVLEVTSPAQWVLSEIGAEDLEFTDHGVRAVVTVGNRAWFQSLLLSLGRAVVRVEPAEIKETLQAAARRALTNYDVLNGTDTLSAGNSATP